MNPFGTRARADELDRLLQGGGALTATGPMASYALVADRLRTAGAALAPVSGPRDEFRAALRTRLVAVATVQAHNAATAVVEDKPRALEAAVSWTQGRRVQRAMGVTAGAMASVVAVAGIAVAGNQSLPGDPFYGVKKGAEALQLRTAGDDVSKGSKHLDFAAERLSEVRGLALGRDAALGPIAPGTASALGGSVAERVRDTLAAMDAETRKGSDLLTDAYRDSQDEDTLEILTSFADEQTAGLRELLPELPASARPAAEDSLALVTGVSVEARQLLAVGVCTDTCSPTAPSPTLPGGGPAPQPAPTATPCGCPETEEPRTSTSNPTPSPEPSGSKPTPTPQPEPTPTPQPSSSSQPPVPLPVPTPSFPVPLPTLPVPLPSLSPAPLPLPLPEASPIVEPLVNGLTSPAN